MKTNSQAGLSLVELMIGAAITGVLAIAGFQLLKNSNTIFSKTVTRLTFQSDRDFNFRKLREEIQKSSVLRSSLLKCTSSLQDASGVIDINTSGQEISLAFSTYSTIGAVAGGGGSSITVPDSGFFRPGNFVALESLDQDSVRGLFRVNEIIDGQTVRLDQEVMIDKAMGCEVAANTDLSTILSSSVSRKFAVSILQFAKYSMLGKNLHKRLQADSGKVIIDFPPLQNFNQLKVDYEFTNDYPDSQSGTFMAQIESSYGDVAASGTALSKRLSLEASYTIKEGLVLNQNSNVEALSSNLVFPSCVVTVSSVKNAFAKKCPDSSPNCTTQDEFRNFYKVNVLISEANYFTTTKAFPQVSISAVNSGEEVTCWTEDMIDSGKYYNRFLLDGDGTKESIQLQLDRASGKKIIPRSGDELFAPVICEVPDAASFNAEMKFTVISTSGVKRGLVACTNFNVAKTTKTFIFSKPPSCSKNAAISFGTLTASDKSEVPELYLKSDACSWNGGGDNCSIHQVMMGKPDAKLDQITFYPTNVQYKTNSGAAIDTTINCN